MVWELRGRSVRVEALVRLWTVPRDSCGSSHGSYVVTQGRQGKNIHLEGTV